MSVFPPAPPCACPHPQRWLTWVCGPLLLTGTLAGCSGEAQSTIDAAVALDASQNAAAVDASADASAPDATPDAGTMDTGIAPPDGGVIDAGLRDTGVHEDAGPEDGGADAGHLDAGGPEDAGAEDGGAGGPNPGLGIWSWSPLPGAPNRPASVGGYGGVYQVYDVGGALLVSGGRRVNHIDLYYPSLDETRPAAAEAENLGPADVWTGTQFIRYGGSSQTLYWTSTASGFVYDLWRDHTRWMPITTTPGPGYDATSAWTGRELVIFGARPAPDDVDPPFTDGARYDPASGQWSLLPTQGQPAVSNRAAASAWTGAAFVVFDGTTAGSGRWVEALDAWQPISMPSLPIAPEASVWTGRSLFVFEGGQGALYDPASDAWTLTATTGLPSARHAVWTGAEILVVGETGGAHYDPALDQWRSMPTHGAVWPNGNRAVAWTGEALLVLGIGPEESAKYTPRLSGMLACTGQAGGLDIRFEAPASRVVVDGMVTVRVSASGASSVSQVRWYLGGSLQPLTALSGTVDASGLTAPVTPLRVEVTDFDGNTACLVHDLLRDAPPQMQTNLPRAGEIGGGAGLGFDVRCSDAEGPCRVRARLGADVIAASAYPAGPLSTLADISSVPEGPYQVQIEVEDARGQQAIERRDVYVLRSHQLVAHAEVPGTLCDADATRVLYQDGAELVLHHLTTGADQRITPSTALECGDSRLLPVGALVVDQSLAYHWDGAVQSSWSAQGTRTRGPWVASHVGRTLELRNLVHGTQAVISTSAHTSDGYDVGDNGVLYWVDTTGTVHRYEAGSDRNVGFVASAPGRPQVVTTGTVAVWRVADSGGVRLDIWDGASVSTLAPPTSAFGFPSQLREEHYHQAGEWLLYGAEDPAGNTQVFLRTPGGATQTVTGFAEDTVAVAVNAAGDVIYERADRLVLRRQGSASHVNIGPTMQAIVHGFGPDLYVHYGRQLFRVQ